MPDNQWPRFEVFKQDKPGQPHRNVGTVHAPDAELALSNARDVFSRRPACHSLWVVPAAAILARTVEELAAARPDSEAGGEQYAVFQKRSQRQAMTYVDYVGAVAAGSAEGALAAALAEFPDEDALVWWVCRSDTIGRSEAADAPLFAVAAGKKFRMPNQYHTVTAMQRVRRDEEGG